MGDLVLMQRGEPAVLSREQYESDWADALSVLDAQKVINVHAKTDYVLIYPNQYVGTARCGGRRLRIAAKYPELLAELRRNFRLQRTVHLVGYNPAGESRETRDDVVRFLMAAANVIDKGIPFDYQKRRYEGASLSGALNISETIRKYASRGMHHRAVTDKSVKTADASTLNVVWRVAELLDDERALAPEEAARLDVLLTAIGHNTQELSRAEALAQAEALFSRFEDRAEMRELAIACVNLLAPSQSQADVEAVTDSVSYVFTDVDALWERAVHQALQTVVARYGWHARLHPLRGVTSRLFDDGGPDIDPDVLVYDGSAKVVMVVDAKDFAQTAAEPSGVYQVVAYTRSLMSGDGVLIYLSSKAEWDGQFGDEQLRIHAAGVRPFGSDCLSRLRTACEKIADRIHTELVLS